MTIHLVENADSISPAEIEKVTDFLLQHLGKYGDSRSAIRKAIGYAIQEKASAGGYVFVAKENQHMVGAVVVNKTGMDEYIPENILVYIAIHPDYRGQGIGKKLMESVIKSCDGDIALHVEKDNPARFLYEKLGFTNPYLEMRLKK